MQKLPGAACSTLGRWYGSAMTITQWAIFLFVLVATNITTGYVVKNAHPKVDHQRDMVEALAKMGRTNGPFIVIIGDSLTQSAQLPTSVCGMPLINAGIGGSRVSTFIPFAEEMTARGIAPAAIIIALGVNDTHSSYRTDFATAYTLLLESLPKAPVALATIAPAELEIGEAEHLSKAAIDTANSAIRNEARTKNLPLIELSHLPNFKTLDGIHPEADSYTNWNTAIIDGAKTIIKCHSSAAR